MSGFQYVEFYTFSLSFSKPKMLKRIEIVWGEVLNCPYFCTSLAQKDVY